MSIVTGIAVFLVIWWTVLFAMLPIGVERLDDVPPGHDRGAPRRPRLLLKSGLTTLISAVIWLGFYLVYVYDLLSFRRLAEGS